MIDLQNLEYADVQMVENKELFERKNLYNHKTVASMLKINGNDSTLQFFENY